VLTSVVNAAAICASQRSTERSRRSQRFAIASPLELYLSLTI
jgi:hypothetical protein